MISDINLCLLICKYLSCFQKFNHVKLSKKFIARHTRDLKMVFMNCVLDSDSYILIAYYFIFKIVFGSEFGTYV